MPNKYFKTSKSTKPAVIEPIKAFSKLKLAVPAIEAKNSIVLKEMKRIASIKLLMMKKSISSNIIKGFFINLFFSSSDKKIYLLQKSNIYILELPIGNYETRTKGDNRDMLPALF